MLCTHHDIQPLQAGEALEEVNHCIQSRVNFVKSQNPHGVHFGCQAGSDHFLQKHKNKCIYKNNSLRVTETLNVQWMNAAAT